MLTDDQILDSLLQHEGGYVDHPLDKGGPTNYGITQGTLAQWRGHSVTADEVRALPVSEARAIYRTQYLAPLADVPADVKPHVVDIAINSGIGTARHLYLLAQQQSRRPVKTQLVVERLRFYAQLVHAHPSQAVFLNGWINRACEYL